MAGTLVGILENSWENGGGTMKRGWALTLVLACVMCSSVCTAQEGEGSNEPIVFKEIIITATPERPEEEKVTKEVLDFGTYVNIGEALDALPGVSVVRRGASSTEPVIRGLGWERVQTQVGPVPIFGGCPSRMDPPVIYLLPDSVQDVTVAKGVPSVTLGPAGTAGRVTVSTDYKRSSDAPPEIHGWVTSTYNGARNGVLGGAGFQGGNKLVDFYGVFNGLDYGDYESADGTEVPADQTEYGGALSFAVRPSENHRWSNGLIFVKDEGADFPSTPMDSEWTKTWIYNTGYTIDRQGSLLERLEFAGGFAILDHEMSNRDKSNRSIMAAQANTSSDSFAGKAKQDWRLDSCAVLTTGVDYYQLSRDGTRERLMLQMPIQGPFFDHIWPEATQLNFGAFSELNVDLAPNWHLRAGGRVDTAQSDADGVDDLSLGGLTIREQFIKFNGPEAGDVGRTETLGSGNVLIEWMAMDELFFHAGGGAISRPASVTERFYAFAPGVGGYQLGNPALDPEVKYEVEVGADWRKPWGIVGISLFHFWVDDFILPTQVGVFPMDLKPIRGFRNVDARLWGGELAGLVRPIDHWSFPFSLSYVRGKNVSEDRDLPEIPPFEARLAVRAEYGKAFPWWVEFGGRFVTRQEDVDSEFPEDETPGFAVFHLYTGFKPMKSLRIQLGIDNLFDKEYHEHLTREAIFTTTNLLDGDEVSAPGISFFATARYEF
jgi:iron complex outermembrane recepter protein